MKKKLQPSELRSKIMRAVKSKNTSTEMLIRKMLWALGYRYRLHVKSLPGTPDIVFMKAKKAIFVNGCFWHGHSCPKGQLPKSNIEFWQDKLQKNIERDSLAVNKLHQLGWETLVIWQCETKDLSLITTKITSFIHNKKMIIR